MTVHSESTQRENCIPKQLNAQPKLESPKSPSIVAPATTETLDITARKRKLDISFYAYVILTIIYLTCDRPDALLAVLAVP